LHEAQDLYSLTADLTLARGHLSVKSLSSRGPHGGFHFGSVDCLYRLLLINMSEGAVRLSQLAFCFQLLPLPRQIVLLAPFLLLDAGCHKLLMPFPDQTRRNDFLLEDNFRIAMASKASASLTASTDNSLKATYDFD